VIIKRKILYFYSVSNLYKTTALFFSAVLFFISITTESYGLLLNSKLQKNGYESVSPYFSLEKPNLFLLNRYGEKSIISIKNLPVPVLKNFTNYIGYNSISLEIRKSGFNSDYLSYSGNIYCSLRNIDIVFPFHYFW
jgi:hypothetical protein